MSSPSPPTPPGPAHTAPSPPAAPVAHRGQALLNQPLLNKDTAFSEDERKAFALEGLLPAAIGTIEQQARRACHAVTRNTDPLGQYIALAALQDRNEHLYYRLLLDDLEQFLPIVYTPTVGLACQQFSHIFRRPRGMWITPEHRGRIEQVLANAPSQNVRLIVATDNGRILGLGDLGAGGIGIPIGKLALYTLGAGIHPAHTLPISLDVGTDNQQLLDDDLYIGWRQPRLRGDPYLALIDEFVEAVRRRFPRALLQWEDFQGHNALALLDAYRDRILSFNDDIQGTAAVVVAAVLAASRATGTPLDQQRIVIVGAGAAGIGITRQLRTLLRRHGVRGPQLQQAVAVLDSRGLVHAARSLSDPAKAEVAWPAELARSAGLDAADPPPDLARVVRAVRPTVLVGVSGVPGVFSERVVRLMAEQVDRPVILPLSNPTSQSEARPDDLLAWTDGRALIATGSPFQPVHHRGRTIPIAQANNIYIFPGVGLGALTAESPAVTDAMFAAAAEALADTVPPRDLDAGLLFPPLTNLRPVTASIAAAVIRQAVDDGAANAPGPAPDAPAILDRMWTPAYHPMTPART